MTADRMDGADAPPLPVSRRVMGLAGLLRQTARRLPDRVGFVHGERVWTWREIDGRVDALAAALAAHGIGKRDRVLVQSPNGLPMFLSMWAAFRLGAVWVPTNHRLTPGEVADLAAASGAKAMLCHADDPAHAAACRSAVPDLATVISIGPADFTDLEVDRLIAAHAGEAVPEPRFDHDDPCWFFFTSGTTGKPKAAVLTHGQMSFVVTNHLADLVPGTTEDDASLVVAPLSHGAGVHQLMMTARGAPAVLPAGPGFDPATAWAMVERWRVTNLFTVPTILTRLVRHPAVHAHDHTSLRHVIYAGAPMYREDQKQALRILGPVLVQYFGLGEVTGAITVLPSRLHIEDDDPAARVGTCGYPRTGMEITIQDDAGRILPPGEMGEICVAGPAVFAGYWNDPEATAKAFRDGWFRTGDLGHLDAEGFLYITGRASDMYISGGSNIYPREIEEVLLTHPVVTEAAVVGVPDPEWGEVGVAVLVVRAGSRTPSVEDILGFLDGKIARYKRPKRIVFRDALPKSGYGKVTKRLIKEDLVSAAG